MRLTILTDDNHTHVSERKVIIGRATSEPSPGFRARMSQLFRDSESCDVVLQRYLQQLGFPPVATTIAGFAFVAGDARLRKCAHL